MDRARKHGMVGNNHVQNLIIEKNRREHIERIKKIMRRKAGTSITLDNSPPVVVKAAQSNPRKIALKEQLNFVTERENRVLLKRIGGIMTAPPKITDQDYQEMKKLVPTSKGGLREAYEHALVMKKNREFFNNIKTIQPYYRHKQWEKEYEHQLFNQKFMRQVTYKRPPDFVDPFADASVSSEHSENLRCRACMLRRVSSKSQVIDEGEQTGDVFDLLADIGELSEDTPGGDAKANNKKGSSNNNNDSNKNKNSSYNNSNNRSSSSGAGKKKGEESGGIDRKDGKDVPHTCRRYGGSRAQHSHTHTSSSAPSLTNGSSTAPGAGSAAHVHRVRAVRKVGTKSPPRRRSSNTLPPVGGAGNKNPSSDAAATAATSSNGEGDGKHVKPRRFVGESQFDNDAYYSSTADSVEAPPVTNASSVHVADNKQEESLAEGGVENGEDEYGDDEFAEDVIELASMQRFIRVAEEAAPGAGSAGSDGVFPGAEAVDPLDSANSHNNNNNNSNVKTNVYSVNASVEASLVDGETVVITAISLDPGTPLDAEAEIALSDLAVIRGLPQEYTFSGEDHAFLQGIAKEIVGNVELKVDSSGVARLVLNLVGESDIEFEEMNVGLPSSSIHEAGAGGGVSGCASTAPSATVAGEAVSGVFDHGFSSSASAIGAGSVHSQSLAHSHASQDEVDRLLLDDRSPLNAKRGCRMQLIFNVSGALQVANSIHNVVELAKKAKNMEQVFALVRITTTSDDQLKIVVMVNSTSSAMYAPKRGSLSTRPVVCAGEMITALAPLPSIVQADPDMIPGYAENLFPYLQIEHDMKTGENSVVINSNSY